MLTEDKLAFHRSLVSLNGLDSNGFTEWLFLPSMLFASREKWWSDGGSRDAAHEGIDIFMYRTVDGSVRYLDGSFQIPAIAAGTVEAVIDDFLGRSIFISHETLETTGSRLCTAYGHTVPGGSVIPGVKLREGAIVGTIAESSRPSVRSHLHISVMRIPNSVRPDELNWDTINQRNDIVLIDPLSVIDLPHTITDLP